MLDDDNTPYHIICESPGDYHELLDLMIKSSQRTIIDVQNIYKCTALLYAVYHANINCVKCLIANGADVNLGSDRVGPSTLAKPAPQWTPIMEAIWKVYLNENRSAIKTDIFNLLLCSGVDIDNPSFEYHISVHESYMSAFVFAVHLSNIYCIEQLIKKGDHLDVIGYCGVDVWLTIDRIGNVELLKCMFNHGVDKDSTDQYGLGIFWYVVDSGNIEVVRYLLDLGVAIPSQKTEARETPCERCKMNRLALNCGTGKDPRVELQFKDP